MYEHERRLRPAMAVVILICFLMPFVKLTCGGQQIASITGLNLATGTTLKQIDQLRNFPQAQAYKMKQAEESNPTEANQLGQPTTPDYPSAPDEPFAQNPTPNPLTQAAAADGTVKAEPNATVALICAVVALLAAFASSRRSMFVSALAAGACAVALLILKTNGAGEMPPDMMGVIAIEWALAFWVALFGSGALAAFTFHILAHKKEEPRKPRLVIGSYQEKVPS